LLALNVQVDGGVVPVSDPEQVPTVPLVPALNIFEKLVTVLVTSVDGVPDVPANKKIYQPG
jgi:hypothetical protein